MKDYSNTRKMKIIAVDFDGTLCENKYPDIGAPRKQVIDRLLAEQANGTKIILWTCRTDEQVEKAVAWCKDQGLIFDAVNDNLGHMKDYFGCNPRKIFAHEYWDDRAVSVIGDTLD